MRPILDSSRIHRVVQICVAERGDVELLQSAEIVARELRFRCIQVLHVDLSASSTWLRVLLSHETLRSGQAEIINGQSRIRVALEDVVDKILEMADVSSY